jgi:hypothetical protein
MTLRQAIEQLLNELESHQLRVELVPLNPRLRGYNEGGCKRVCSDLNPKWYRHLCAAHLSSREVRRGKPDTRIKRRNTLRALRQMLQRQPAGKYETDLRQIAQQMRLDSKRAA